MKDLKKIQSCQHSARQQFVHAENVNNENVS